MKKFIYSSALIVVIAVSAGWASWKIRANRARLPVKGLIHRSTVDRFGHTRGIVQVDLMRKLMADRASATSPPAMPAPTAGRQTTSQDHALLRKAAPVFVLADAWGKTWSLREEISRGPVVLVFYLGSTCMACITHLTELDAALPRFRARRAQVIAISGDSPGFSMERMRNFGEFQIPLLSDADRAVSRAYGVWKIVAGRGEDDGEAEHGTFIVGRDGLVRWAYVGDRPFTDIEALLTALDGF